MKNKLLEKVLSKYFLMKNKLLEKALSKEFYQNIS